MLAGRLGLEKARIPHADRHGLVWLERGRLEVEDGCLRFITAGGGDLDPGNYQIPHQAVSIILLGPGSSVTHDALRLLARHGCALAAVGEGAVRFYTAPPLLPDSSAAARSQVTLWADPKSRMEVARAMYAMRFGEFVLTRDIDTLRGQEGARIKRSYQLAAQRFGIPWNGRLYDRANPDASDTPNQALNHAQLPCPRRPPSRWPRLLQSRNWALFTKTRDRLLSSTSPIFIAMTSPLRSRSGRSRNRSNPMNLSNASSGVELPNSSVNAP